MFHLIGATLIVLATIGVVFKLGEYFHNKDEDERRRLAEEEHRKKLLQFHKESKLQEQQVRQAAIKRREKREEEIKRILYGIPIEEPTNTKELPWWRFGKSNTELTPIPTSLIYQDSEAEFKAQEEFRAKNPFISIKIPSQHMSEFLQEFTWLQSKTGNIPSIEDQKSILIGIVKNS
jgi:hypothetical protein